MTLIDYDNDDAGEKEKDDVPGAQDNRWAPQPVETMLL
jgi:hypothetical protein